jgi:hypothetical protein
MPRTILASSISCNCFSSEFNKTNVFNPILGNTLSNAAATSRSTSLSLVLAYGGNSRRNLQKGDSSGVYICKSEENDLKHGNYISKSVDNVPVDHSVDSC